VREGMGLGVVPKVERPEGESEASAKKSRERGLASLGNREREW
jgi:hypothetical protein